MAVNLSVSRGKTPLILKANLALVGRSHSLRCDAKQAEKRFAQFDKFIESVEHFYLGDYLPHAFVKGDQPKYIENLEEYDGVPVPVINTLVIQRLTVRRKECRYITQEDFADIAEERKPKVGDVLLTVDGGVSIGKPFFFTLDGDYAIDSHVAILRPHGLDAKVLTYLLASPLGQLQFQRAESGASGQTGVGEDDLRRFRFPVLSKQEAQKLVEALDADLRKIKKAKRKLQRQERQVWSKFDQTITAKAKRRSK